MGYEVIDTEEFFESMKGKKIEVIKMSRENGELKFSPMMKKTIENLINEIHKNINGYICDIETKTTKDKNLIEVIYTGIDNIKYLDTYILKEIK